jgi:hypothetical protein
VKKKPGRNEPCPCGSGKKAKQCHGLDAPAADATPAAPDSGVVKALDWLELRHPKAMHESFTDFVFNDIWPEKGPPPQELEEQFLNAILYPINEVWFASGDIRLGARQHRVIDLVRGALGAQLSQVELSFLNELDTNWHRLYRVLEPTPDGACLLMDALDLEAEPIRIDAPDQMESFSPGLLVGVRLVTVEGRQELSGVWFEFPAPFDIRALNFVTEAAEGEYEEEEDRAYAIETEIATCWVEMMVEAEQAGAAAAPQEEAGMDDADEPLFITDHYQVLDEARLTRILDACPLLDSELSPGWALLDLDENEDGCAFQLEILRGSKPDRLEVQYGSAADAEAGRPWFEGLVGDAVRYLTRDISDPAQMLDEDVMQEFEHLPPEILARLAVGMPPALDPEWPNEPHPELDGATPMEAARKKAGAAKVRKLLLAMEEDEARIAREHGVQPLPLQFLWDQLGLQR